MNSHLSLILIYLFLVIFPVVLLNSEMKCCPLRAVFRCALMAVALAGPKHSASRDLIAAAILACSLPGL